MPLLNLCLSGLLFLVPILLIWVWMVQISDSREHRLASSRMPLLLIFTPSLITVILILSRDFGRHVQFPAGETLEGKLLLIVAHPVMSVLAVFTVAYHVLNSLRGNIATALRTILIVTGISAWATTLIFLLITDAHAIVDAYGKYRYYGVLNVFTTLTLLGIAVIPQKQRSPLITLFLGMLGTVLGVLFMQGLSE